MRIEALLVLLLHCIKANGIVCSEDEFIKELREDLADNNKLDCTYA